VDIGAKYNPLIHRLQLNYQAIGQNVVSHEKVLRVLARLEPHQAGRDTVQNETGNRLTFFGGQFPTVRSRNKKVKQILFPFKLVPVSTNGTAEVVRLGTNHVQSERGWLLSTRHLKTR
jgi:hypothetical protein